MLTVLAFLAATLPLRAEQVFIEHKGLELNAQLQLVEGKAFSDGIVLILHGLLGHNRMEIIESAQQALVDNGQSSLAINLSLDIDNRHGFYDCDTPQTHLQADALDELDAWVSWLRLRGVADITLMAHSRGGNQAMVYAAERPAPEIRRLVLLAPGTVVQSEKLFEARYGGTFALTSDRAKRLHAAGQGGRLMENVDFLYCPRSTVAAATFLSYYGDNSRFRNFPRYLPLIELPTLITLGSLDETQPDAEKQLFPFADGERIRVRVIEGAGHFFRDFNIDEAIEGAIEFIAAHR